MPRQPTRTNFVNLQSYMNANQAGANQLGADVANGLDADAGEAQRRLQNAETDFNRAVQQGSVADPGRFQGWIVYDEDKKDAINRYTPYENAGYKGPMSLTEQEGFADIAKKAGEAGDRAAFANTEFGVNEELRNRYGRPQYTGGQSALDAGLALNSATGQARLGATQQRFGKLREMMTGAVDRGITTAQTAKDSSEANAKKGKEYLQRARDARTSGARPQPVQTPVETPVDRVDRVPDWKRPGSRGRREWDNTYVP